VLYRANYFLLRNGEFSLSLIREIERLKLSRLTTRSGPTSMIREQDLNLALLRASLGTTAQHDPTLSLLRFSLPSGPLRPLLPSLATTDVNPTYSPSTSTTYPGTTDPTLFTSHLLGTPLTLNYTVSWPLDLFLHSADLNTYATLFAYLSALRKTHTRIHTCWTSLSNAQRARRRWTGLGEGGTHEDLEARSGLLRCGWGVVRDMGWFLDTLLGYVMMDVVDVEFAKLKERLGKEGKGGGDAVPAGKATPVIPMSGSTQSVGNAPNEESMHLPPSNSITSTTSTTSHLDFTTLRTIHTTYLDRLLTGCLLTNPALTSILRPIFEVCERFVAQVERWGGDVLPALLFEGSLKGGSEQVGAMVRERWVVVAEINEVCVWGFLDLIHLTILDFCFHVLQMLHTLLESFYEQLSLSTSQQPFTATTTDASKSIIMNASIANYTTHNLSRGVKGMDVGGGEVRRHVERLLLRLDFNGGFSKPRARRGTVDGAGADILVEGGLI